ncbi:MAG: phosphotransacetylase family protein, partial [Halobacteriales archaeon]|nr:phosphotransacetylase family protein [Halobacteriales archaeon]
IRGQEDPEELRRTVKDRFEDLAADQDLMVVEGGGSLTTGGIVNLTDPDVADLLDAEVLLIAAYEAPGDVDDVLAAAQRVGDRLTGVLFNAVADADFDTLAEDVVPFLESRGIDVPGVVPYTRDLAGVTVETLATELGADVVTDAPTDAFVERFLVGAMAADSALRFFRRTKDAAVITGGDRADIQTAALESPGVKCLILTGGFRPPGAVVGKAEQRGVPILSVRSDTLATVERAENVVRSGRTRNADTVARMRDLLEEHARVDLFLDDDQA